MSEQPVAVLGRLAPAVEEAWRLLFGLADADPTNWCLLGGQMMYLLLAAEASRTLPRPTDDVDVVVDVRARPDSTEWLAGWLRQQGLELEGVSPEGIGHRFVRTADPGPGQVIFDVLAPEGLGERANLYTKRPAKTLSAPGTTQALERAELVMVEVADMDGSPRSVGRVRRPSLLGALVCKAAATTIATREHPERDWQDAALALSLVEKPMDVARQCTRKDRQRLRLLSRLLEPADPAWRPLSDADRRLGIETLGFLIGAPRSQLPS